MGDGGGRRHERTGIGFQCGKKTGVTRHDCLSQTSNKSEELATKASHCHVNRRIDAYRKEKEEDRAVFPHLTDGCISRKMLQSKDSNNYLVSFPRIYGLLFQSSYPFQSP